MARIWKQYRPILDASWDSRKREEVIEALAVVHGCGMTPMGPPRHQETTIQLMRGLFGTDTDGELQAHVAELLSGADPPPLVRTVYAELVKFQKCYAHELGLLLRAKGEAIHKQMLQVSP